MGRSFRFFVCVFTVAIFAWAGARASLAQQPASGDSYRTLTPPSMSRAEQVAASRLWQADSLSAENDALLTKYLSLKLAEMTLHENRKDFHALRQGVKRDLQRSRNAAAHTRANEFLLAELPKVALSDEFNPAVRQNFMLLVGDLDAQEYRIGGSPAVPLPAALPVLLGAVNDAAQIDAVKAAALVGAARHVESGSTQGVSAAMGQFLNTLNADAQANRVARDPQVRAWLESRAIEILAQSGQTPADVPPLLASRLADSSTPLWLRYRIAQALGKMNAGAALDGAALVQSMASVVIASTVQADNVRVVMEALSSVKTGLSGDGGGSPGIVNGLQPPTRELADQLLQAVDGMLALFSDPRLVRDDLALLDAVRQRGAALQSQWPAAADAPPAAAPDAAAADAATPFPGS